VNILALIDFNQIIYNLMTGIYSVVAHIYDLMLKLVESSNFNRLGIDFSSTIEPFYVLAGIFMLFRIVVSFLNYIVEPDRVSSSDAGAGKMITRILVSILLLMLLRPGHSIVYNFLDDIQDALLASDGLIANIAGQDYKLKNNNESLVVDVNAADTLTCYYDIGIRKFTSSYYNSKEKFTHQAYLKAIITKKNNGVSVKFEQERIAYSADRRKVTTAKVVNPIIDDSAYSFNDGCPYIVLEPTLESNVTTIKDRKFILTDSVTAARREDKYSTGRPTATLKDAVDHTAGKDDSVLSDVENEDGNNQHLFVHYAIKASDDALDFTSSMGRSFLTCNVGDGFSEKDCNGLLKEMFRGGDDDIVDAINDSKISFSGLPSIIVGIVLIVFLIVLCVDVVVRGFKMFLLQMIAPIPIVSYINPKDKMLSEWIKMYAATYVNLFLQLMAIKVGCVFLNILCTNSKFAGLEKVFWAIGILVFIKMVPSMISKIFGLDLAGGTLKDSMGMLKAGLGFGAGAVAGGIGGLATGIMAGAVVNGGKGKKAFSAFTSGAKGLTKGLAYGAGAGSKGKPMSGFDKVVSENTQKRIGNLTGATAAGTIGARMMQKFGFDDAYTKAVNEKKDYEKVQSEMSNLEDQALAMANKNAGNGSNVKEFADLRNARNIYSRVQAGETVKRSLKWDKDTINTFANSVKEGETITDETTGRKFTYHEIKTIQNLVSSGMEVDRGETTWDIASAEASFKKAEKFAREKVINDVAIDGMTSEQLVASGYVTSGASQDDMNVVKSAYNVADESAKQAGFDNITKIDKDGKKVYDKGQKDIAKNRAQEAEKAALANKANHDAAQRNSK